MRRRRLVPIPLLGVLIMLAACGGGGHGHDRSPTPTPTPTEPPRAGTLDESFGTAGVVLTAFPGPAEVDDVVYALAVQPDGAIVAAGVSTPVGELPAFGIARYRPDGSLDPTFGDGGRVRPMAGIASAVAVAPDGTIVVAGDVTDGFGLVRLDRDGRVDASFGSDGVVLSPAFITGPDLAIQPDGRIVVAGTLFANSTTSFGLLRYEIDGTLDPTFGDHGIATTGIGTSNDARALLLQPDGKILVGGSGQPDGASNRFLVVRYLADGSLDAAFGDGGIVQTDVTPGRLSRIAALDVQEDGSILALGPGGIPGIQDPFPPNPDGGPIVMARYRADGSLDEAFGDGGILPTVTSINPGTPILVQPDGKILVGDGLGFRSTATVRRLDADGTVDETFGEGGTFAIEVQPDADSAFEALALEPDGHLIAAGASRPSMRLADFALVRIHLGSTGQ